METGVKPWVDSRLDDQNTKIQRRLDGFELRITCTLEGIKDSNLARVKAEIAELQKLVNELHERPVFPMSVIMMIYSEEEVKIFGVSKLKKKEETKK